MGGGGSKAAAAQKAAARAAAAATKPPAAAARAGVAAATEATQAHGISAAQRQREAELRQQQAAAAAQPLQQAQDNAELVRSMNKVMAGMHQYQYEIYRNPEVDKKYAMKKKTKEEKEAELVGRLDTSTLKQLLEEHARSVQLGKPLTAAELAKKYGANPEVLEKVLHWCTAPVLVKRADGQVVGRWPGGNNNSSNSGGKDGGA